MNIYLNAILQFCYNCADTHRNISRRMLDVPTLTQLEGYHVVVPWNMDTDQSIGSGGHLLN